MARSMMYLFAAGAAVTFASLLISPPGTGLPRIAATGACALALSVLVLLVFDRIPVWGFQALLAAGTLLVEWAVYASGDQTSPYAMFYFWIAIYSFYFLSRARAAMQMAFIGIAYAAVVTHGDAHATPVIHWAFVTSILVVAGAFIGVQRGHVERLIARLSDAARTDPLTGLHNRRGFEELFDTELERARRGGRPPSGVGCHPHAVKGGNDPFRHPPGDRAPQEHNASLQRAQRGGDTAARVGGR